MQAALQPTGIRKESSAIPQATARNLAIDSYRGLVMLLMMAEVLELSQVSRAFPGNWFWSFLAYNQTHVSWAGCSLHDTIQPGFSFLVGVALPYSVARRIAQGGSFSKLFAHALWRSLLLVALGVFLRSTSSQQTYFTFEDTLSQIGLGYPILFLLAWRPPRWQWIALGAILCGYWLAWALYPGIGPGAYTGFAAHWNKQFNFGNAFDQWFLNLFPRTSPYVANSGGYLTLSFIPTLGTMILGLIGGEWLRSSAPKIPMKRLLIAAAAGISAGLLLHFTGICPVVKRIWTPSWTLFSGGTLLPLPGRLLLADRSQRLAPMDLPAGSDRYELDCRLPDRPSLGALHHRFVPHQPRSELLSIPRRRPRTPAARHRRAPGLLAGSLLDVPAQAVPEDLTVHAINSLNSP